MAYAVSTDADNTGLDGVVFFSRGEAESAVRAVSSMYSADRIFTVYETTEPATTTFVDWAKNQ